MIVPLALSIVAAIPTPGGGHVILLKPETAATVRFAAPGGWASVPEIVTPPSPDTRRSAVALQSTPEAHVRETLQKVQLPDARPPAVGRVTAELHRLDGRPGVMLMIGNGYQQRLVYQAVLLRKGLRQPTTVCAVLPGKYGIESWPYPVDGIELGGFVQSDTMPADC